MVKDIPKQFIPHFLLCLKKTGMTPMAKIFTKLSEKPQYKEELISYQYPERVTNLLLDKSNENFKMVVVDSFDSYFGSDSS